MQGARCEVCARSADEKDTTREWSGWYKAHKQDLLLLCASCASALSGQPWRYSSFWRGKIAVEGADAGNCIQLEGSCGMDRNFAGLFFSSFFSSFFSLRSIRSLALALSLSLCWSLWRSRSENRSRVQSTLGSLVGWPGDFLLSHRHCILPPGQLIYKYLM